MGIYETQRAAYAGSQSWFAGTCSFVSTGSSEDDWNFIVTLIITFAVDY
ncbi:MAG: hypothetical protein ACYSTX_02855 [Planctomycetota bacterium]